MVCGYLRQWLRAIRALGCLQPQCGHFVGMRGRPPRRPFRLDTSGSRRMVTTDTAFFFLTACTASSILSRMFLVSRGVRMIPTAQQIRLPLSSKRGEKIAYLKLLRHVEEHARSGFDYHGEFLTPGKMVCWADVRPTIEYPEVPVLLECAGIAKPGRGHNRSEYLYILWQWCPIRNAFVELARSSSVASEWATDLEIPARRAIGERRPEPDPGDVRRRIADYLSRELERALPPDRFRILAVIHDELASRMAQGRGRERAA